jgi:hypothetical protein
MAEKKRVRNKSTGRNYDKEYASYQGSPAQIKKRAQRNSARAKMAKAGKVSKGDGRDVDHRKGLSAGNGSSNLRVQKKATNRSFSRTRTGKKKGK